MEWLTSAQVSGRTHRHPDSVRRAAELGELHGHQAQRNGKSVRGSRWSFHPDAADAWVQGHDLAAQTRACGCAPIRAVPAAARRTG